MTSKYTEQIEQAEWLLSLFKIDTSMMEMYCIFVRRVQNSTENKLQENKKVLQTMVKWQTNVYFNVYIKLLSLKAFGSIL